MAPASILVVEDDDSLAEVMAIWLKREERTVLRVSSGEQALQQLDQFLPEVIFLDLSLPGITGLEVLKAVVALSPQTPVIITTADAQVETVVNAMRLGAWDYLVKPFDRTRLLTTLKRSEEHGQLKRRLSQLEQKDRRGYGDILGQSPAMLELFRQLDRLAPTKITVLIYGESGTGKELIARALHQHGGRSKGPLVAINCAAIPPSLQESELFGHEKGAFTGALERRAGVFEKADGGTLFLDEVAELSPSLQAQLLRVIQEKSFLRVGGQTPITSDFRLITASHRRLKDEVAAGRFRGDLYFRLAVYELEVPPLRARGEDILSLANNFLGRCARPLTLSPEAQKALLAHTWPGNVRELQNLIAYLEVAATGSTLEVSDLPPAMRATSPRPLLAAPEPDEKTAILAALAESGGNVSDVIRRLQIPRTTFYRKIKRYGIPLKEPQ